MAKANYGNIITELAGSINSNTYQRGRYGNIVRRKPHPINRNTAAQAVVRAFFGTLTKGWQALTQVQRNTWLQATLSFQQVNSLANTITLTGHQLYIAINRNLQTITETLLTVAPPKVSVPAFSTASAVAAAGAGTIVLTYTPAIAATEKVEIYASAPLSQGKKSSSQSYKLIRVITSADVSPLGTSGQYETIYGGSWQVAGQKIFFLAKQINIATGEESTTSRFDTVVAA
jgi:hypothetical protein